MKCVHFVRFDKLYGERFNAAVRVFGHPHFVHRLWDQRVQREIGPDDVVVFAKGDEDQPVTPFNYDDSAYQ